MKFEYGKHLIGKVYDLSQENMNAMIGTIEQQEKIIKWLIDKNRDMANASAQGEMSIEDQYRQSVGELGLIQAILDYMVGVETFEPGFTESCLKYYEKHGKLTDRQMRALINIVDGYRIPMEEYA